MGAVNPCSPNATWMVSDSDDDGSVKLHHVVQRGNAGRRATILEAARKIFFNIARPVAPLAKMCPMAVRTKTRPLFAFSTVSQVFATAAVTKKSTYSPIVVQVLPDCIIHFKELKLKLRVNVRPFGKITKFFLNMERRSRQSRRKSEESPLRIPRYSSQVPSAVRWTRSELRRLGPAITGIRTSGEGVVQ
ncbi:hypothetical protein ACJJTC_001930 [Scirpophaga incertulas]